MVVTEYIGEISRNVFNRFRPKGGCKVTDTLGLTGVEELETETETKE